MLSLEVLGQVAQRLTNIVTRPSESKDEQAVAYRQIGPCDARLLRSAWQPVSGGQGRGRHPGKIDKPARDPQQLGAIFDHVVREPPEKGQGVAGYQIHKQRQAEKGECDNQNEIFRLLHDPSEYGEVKDRECSVASDDDALPNAHVLRKELLMQQEEIIQQKHRRQEPREQQIGSQPFGPDGAVSGKENKQ